MLVYIICISACSCMSIFKLMCSTVLTIEIIFSYSVLHFFTHSMETCGFKSHHYWCSVVRIKYSAIMASHQVPILILLFTNPCLKNWHCIQFLRSHAYELETLLFPFVCMLVLPFSLLWFRKHCSMCLSVISLSLSLSLSLSTYQLLPNNHVRDKKLWKTWKMIGFVCSLI